MTASVGIFSLITEMLMAFLTVDELVDQIMES
jgi:hypothetical protein